MLRQSVSSCRDSGVIFIRTADFEVRSEDVTWYAFVVDLSCVLGLVCCWP